MNRGVVFDFDGVIINSFELQKKALHESYKKVGGKGNISEEQFFSHSGNSLENIFYMMGLPLEMLDYYKNYSRGHMDYIKVYQGIEKLLYALNRKEIKCAICTGKERSRTMEILKYFHLQNFFAEVICSDDVERAKPYPDSLLLAINKMNCAIESTMMIGDAPNDIICAQNAGVVSVGVTWGEITRDIIIKNKPDYVVDSVEQLYKVINNFFWR